TLRPPPNVDFVQGYPGIPPGGPDRPQAAVKGAIEVRVGPQGVKAKWVRIELRKIETLPGGGVANTFFDFVGQSPINLWQSPNDEYSTLHANDFPFFIRIPESIPPTISLEKGAGIKYELIASICVQGKKGFLRRDKPTITATASTIIIDKHELHSTWPIYSQPETRTHTQDGVTLIVDRAHTCYGPGDRIVVMATVKSDTVHTVMLRGFEFMLRETTVFRAGPHTQGKKGSPQVKVASIGEQQIPVNVTLSGGTCHKAELIVPIPSNHTSATINAARHIDITYVLTVKALMSTGKPVSMDLPVMISNWPRSSASWILSSPSYRRIGHAFNVSLPGQPAPQHGHISASQANFAPALMGKAALNPPAPNSSSGRTSSSHAYSNSIDKKGSVQDLRSPKSLPGQFATSPIASDRVNNDRLGLAVDEFGSRKKGSDHGHSSFAAQTIGAIKLAADNAAVAPATGRGGSAASSETNSSPAARPRSSNGRSNTAQRLTIANMSEDEIREHMEAEAELARRQPSIIMESPVAIAPAENVLTGSSPAATPKSVTTTPVKANSKPASSPLTQKWATAEDEKKRLYEHAVAKVERVQGRALSTHETSPSTPAGSGSAATPAVVTPAAASKPAIQWESAAQEKARLYEQAQAAVARAHSVGASPASAKSTMSPGAALYADAMSAINKPLVPSSTLASPAPAAVALPMSPQAALSPVPGSTPARQSTTPSLPSATDEKAMLQRYYDAKNKVYQTQTAHYGRVPGNAEPVPYDALYPAAQQAASPTPSQSYPQSQPLSPPPFQASGSSSQHPILSEKERLRRHFEAQDAAARQNTHTPPPPGQWQPPPPPDPYPGSPPPPHAYPQSPPMAPIPPPFSPSAIPSPSQPLSAFEEKEMLRRRYEMQDSAPRNSAVPPTPPPRASQFLNSPRGRPPPTPPSPNAPGSGRPLTAAEEKARLKAMYESEDRQVQRSPPPPVQVPGPPTYGVHVPYPSPPPSNGFHSAEVSERSLASTAVPMTPPPPPPLAPKPPREYIEETRAEDLRTSAKLQAIDNADPSNLIASLKAADPDLASIATTDLRDDDDGDLDGDADADVGGDPGEHTFGPGALSAVLNASAPPSRSNTGDSGSPGASGSNSFPLSVPPPPPLPPKVLVGGDSS
ncbi:hypothetical protein GY45DRAFT_1244637, partial [Cubamyces sp. BRFM 1775]